MMKQESCIKIVVTSCALLGAVAALAAAETAPRIPRFSIDYMDKTVDPAADFFHYAAGNWIKANPVPADKSRWGAFIELQERNWFLIHGILDSTAANKDRTDATAQKVGDFFRSAMDTNRLEELGFKPIQADLKRIENLKEPGDLLSLLADFHQHGVGACFAEGVSPDAKNSAVYAFQLSQGGLGMPDRDYYLTEAYAKQREAYAAYIAKMFVLLGEQPALAKAHSATVMEIETSLAKASKPRVDLRDPIANYHKFAVADIVRDYPDLPFSRYLAAMGLDKVPDIIIRQPEFMQALYGLAKERPLDDWKVYLRWHRVNTAAPYLHAAAEDEAFAFYGKVLRGQLEPEPR